MTSVTTISVNLLSSAILAQLIRYGHINATQTQQGIPMFRWSVAIIFVGLSGLGGLFTLQTKLIYFPDDRPLSDCTPPAPTQYLQVENEQSLVTQTGAKNLAIFFHGNAGSACNWRFLGANHLADLNYDTLVVEYPGYGGDERNPSKAEIEKMLPVINNWVEAQAYETTTIFGYSLGSGVGSLYAQTYGADQIILFAPFDSLYAVAFDQGIKVPRNMLTEDYDNIDALQSVDAPVHIIHGTGDTVIPASHSETLAIALSAAGLQVTRDTLPDRGHEGLFVSPEFDNMLQRVLLFTGEN